MAINIINLFIQFVLIILAQVLILNNIQLSGFINPYIYILFIITLPVKISRLLLLSIAFTTGFIIDLFTQTPGLHAAATVFIAFVRPYILNALAPRDGYDADELPTIGNFGLNWFLIYCSIIIIIHHLVLFYLEMFSFDQFFQTLLRVFISSIFTLFIIILSEYLFSKSISAK